MKVNFEAVQPGAISSAIAAVVVLLLLQIAVGCAAATDAGSG